MKFNIRWLPAQEKYLLTGTVHGIKLDKMYDVNELTDVLGSFIANDFGSRMEAKKPKDHHWFKPA